MNNLKLLIQFTDHITNNGESEPHETWSEGIGIEQPGLACLTEFTDEDWSQLQNYWRDQSDEWIKCLIDLLDWPNSTKSKDMLVNIALQGSDQSTLSAMDCVRSFMSELAPSVKEQLETKLWKIISNRMK